MAATAEFKTGQQITYRFDNGAEDTGKLIKSAGAWFNIEWSNGVKTWLRVERLEERVIAKVPAVKKPSPRKPRPAAKKVSIPAVSELLKLESD